MKMRRPFKFKQFEIQQENVAMPVTTDACILGAYANFENCKTVLDIGAGSGVLGLMLAQRYPFAQITALEIHEPSFLECKKNIENSIFAKRMEAICADILNFKPQNKYDGIVWNPPFFENQLASALPDKKLARHTQGLNYSVFSEILKTNLADTGKAWLLIPDSHLELMKTHLSTAKYGIISATSIAANTAKSPHLWMLNIMEGEFETTFLSMITYGQKGEYGDEMRTLLGGFYLNM